MTRTQIKHAIENSTLKQALEQIKKLDNKVDWSEAKGGANYFAYDVLKSTLEFLVKKSKSKKGELSNVEKQMVEHAYRTFGKYM